MQHDTIDRALPALVGLTLIGAGLALYKRNPSLLALPDPTPLDDPSDSTALVSIAHSLRDQIGKVMPANLASSLSRSLIVTGTALVVVRILDEIAGAAKR